jgi:hypothetical protein
MIHELGLLSAYTISDDQLAKALVPSPLDASYAAQYDAWSEVVSNVQDVVVDEGMTDTKEALLVALTSHRDAWKSVVDSDIAQDEAGFVAASELVSTTHNNLMSVTPPTLTTFAAHVTSTESAIRQFLATTNL